MTRGTRPDGSRRRFMAVAGGTAGLVGAAPAIAASGSAASAQAGADMMAAEPFLGRHQNGIATPNPQQGHTCFAAFDITTEDRKALIATLKAWTGAATRLTAGRIVNSPPPDGRGVADSLDALGLGPARLTLSFGFGPDMFSFKGRDRFGLARHRPAALVDLPVFPGDQLQPHFSGGALGIQACADDPQVAFHAIRELIRMGGDTVAPRWIQDGYWTANRTGGTGRNLMGFKDGTMNPSVDDPASMNRHVWVGGEGPDWMRDGTYCVFRRIRIALEHWDRMPLDFQERSFGRDKLSGAPLGGTKEFQPLDLKATDAHGNPLIAATAHARLAAPQENGGARMLRRGFNYNAGVSFIAERWPPWKQAIAHDAGILFICFQKDPRTAFIRMFEKMSRLDALNQFATHVGSAVFACPGGIGEGDHIGRALFES